MNREDENNAQPLLEIRSLEADRLLQVPFALSGQREQSDAVELLLEHIGETKQLKICALILGLAVAADAVEIIGFGYIISEITDPLNGRSIHSEPIWIILFSVAVLLGLQIGGLAFGVAGDIVGRKYVAVVSLLVNVLAAVLSAITKALPSHIQMPWLLGCRILAGIGVGGSTPLVFTLISELSPKHVRGKYINAVASFWMFGAIYTAGIAWALLHGQGESSLWQSFVLTASFPAFLACILIYLYVPESPRFLLTKGRITEAKQVFRNFDRNDSCSIAQINHILREERLSIPESSLSNSFYSLWEGKIRSVTLLTSIVWFSLSFGAYIITSWILKLYTRVGLVNDPYEASTISALFNLPGNIIAACIIDSVGPTKMVFATMILATISTILLLSGSKLLVLIASSSYIAFSTAGWNGLDAITCDVFPAHCRASAFGVASSWGHIGKLVAYLITRVLIPKITEETLGLIASFTILFGAMSTCRIDAIM